jgi:xanthine dehydrogenase accessory factor
MNRWATLVRAVQSHGPCALINVLSTKGSTPRDADAWMIITPNGFHGSIGGGTLEWKAMAEAQAMLAKQQQKRVMDFTLGPDLGQCCGGRMQIEIEVFDVKSLPQLAERQELDAAPKLRDIYLFGAGHVGRSLVLALAPLHFQVIWIDPRPNAFPEATPGNAKLIQPDDPLSCLESVRLGSLAFIMSHSHALDLALVDATLRNEKFAHVGLIGSATKRARFEKRLAEAGVDPARIQAMICPIGVGGITSKHPAAIAAAVVAQVLQLDAQLTAKGNEERPMRTGAYVGHV